MFWDRFRPVRFIREEITLREAMECAPNDARLVSYYHEGRVILEAEDPGEKEEDFNYWLDRANFYRREWLRLERGYKDRWIKDPEYRQEREEKSLDDQFEESRCWDRFQDRLKTTLFRKMPPKRQFKDLSYLLTTPPESSTVSTPKTRAHRSPMATGRRPVTRNARSNANVTKRRKETNDTRRAVAGNTNTGKGIDRQSSRTTERRKGKNAYRRRTQGAKAEATSPAQERNLARTPPNGLTTPDSGDSIKGRPAGEDRRDCSTQSTGRAAARGHARMRPGSYFYAQNAYVTPDSPQSSRVGVHKRPRRYKGSTRSKRRSNRDGSYRGSRSVLQAIDPVSSRLRNSGVRLDERKL